ncbi:metalloregulator ArsR/SmtB family transcription factor [Streptomyces sp. DH24]|uniref:ArsR/SmtB family transcription factor n=1 Tax=Streptomyces sp. DH24 TaxID=3040123 RepID=UPI002442664C|nr:metalloregulator ArsR/SmtB family transcription factor [Streptomyces sp. DH24]MDG9718500.1 metalloregulator ArsR/SmtB family transcription factor [Streptomyces sp. DH24]
MHLVPADRADRRAIDGHRVCDAIAAIGEPGHVRTWADRFSLLADAKRLALLLALHRTGPLAVSDLAIATGMNDPAVSQALRLLRAAGVVVGEKEGRVVRYRVVDEDVRGLLAGCAADAVAVSEAPETRSR